MTLAAISAIIDHARTRLVELQSTDARHYSDAHAFLGRAQQAVELGDLEACEQWLVRAEEEEHVVTGAVECCAPAFEALSAAR